MSEDYKESGREFAAHLLREYPWFSTAEGASVWVAIVNRLERAEGLLDEIARDALPEDGRTAQQFAQDYFRFNEEELLHPDA